GPAGGRAPARFRSPEPWGDTRREGAYGEIRDEGKAGETRDDGGEGDTRDAAGEDVRSGVGEDAGDEDVGRGVAGGEERTGAPVGMPVGGLVGRPVGWAWASRRGMPRFARRVEVRRGCADCGGEPWSAGRPGRGRAAVEREAPLGPAEAMKPARTSMRAPVSAAAASTMRLRRSVVRPVAAPSLTGADDSQRRRC